LATEIGKTPKGRRKTWIHKKGGRLTKVGLSYAVEIRGEIGQIVFVS
jgi:hypothetical protein